MAGNVKCPQPWSGAHLITCFLPNLKAVRGSSLTSSTVQWSKHQKLIWSVEHIFPNSPPKSCQMVMISLSVPGAGQLRLVVSRCVRYWRVNQKLVWPLVLVYYTVTVVLYMILCITALWGSIGSWSGHAPAVSTTGVIETEAQNRSEQFSTYQFLPQ